VIPLRDTVRTEGWPFVTWALITINVWMFLYELALGPELESFVETFGFVPARYFLLAQLEPDNWAARYLPLLTSMFLHGGWAHLIGNMLYLWIFGDNVEDRLGHLRYLAFYLLTGLGAALAHAYLHPDSVIPTVGASGAISGVLGGYLVLLPHARVITLIPLLFFFVDIVELPAVLYLGFWFVMQFASGAFAMVLAGDAAGVAWWAHVGGFVAGMTLAQVIRRRRSYRRVWADRYALW
jgi:membrane associated rhomboid family serine protease